MTAFLHYGRPARDPVLRHEVAEPVEDSVAFIEYENKRVVVASALDEPVFARREDIVDEFWASHHLGMGRLKRDDKFPAHLLGAEVVLRAVTRVGVSSVIVPPTFPVLVADYLRDKSIEVTADPEAWAARRRRKAPWELEGIERAQRAAETALLAAVRMLRDAERTRDGWLRFEGELLTAELVREAMQKEVLTQGADCERILIQSGDTADGGHDPGVGPLRPDTPCIIDCFPRDRRTGVYTDLTRTFVPGMVSDEIRRMHKLCLEGLDIARQALKPGASDAYRKVAEHFRAAGFATQVDAREEAPLKEGFPHGLGHGVGLELHEPPSMGVRADTLVEGDVVAIEPGLYASGVGGVRLEDTVLITADGVEHFTDPYPYDLEP